MVERKRRRRIKQHLLSNAILLGQNHVVLLIRGEEDASSKFLLSTSMKKSFGTPP
jgi:hypothetical protein